MLEVRIIKLKNAKLIKFMSEKQSKKQRYLKRLKQESKLWDKLLQNVCDVCGLPIHKNQKTGKRKLNDALCHSKCLYYKKTTKICNLSI